MIDEKVCPTNGEPKEDVHYTEEADALLLYQAKVNVKDKRNLFKHILAFIVAWPILGVFYEGVLSNITHPSLWRASNIINSLTAVQPYLPIEGSAGVSSAVSFMNSYFRHNYVPEIWYVIVGMMLAWGAWIAFRVAKRMTISVSKRFRTYFAKKGKLDPVMQEYNRLRGLAKEEAS
ncbi:MAG: hypothetical protein FWF81_05535 [Defluviitaleaceae bacterium]|nr:hypothetical protein [Defluviitaleaceae bacterium]